MKSRKIYKQSKINKRKTNKYRSRKVKKQKTKRRRLVKRKPRKTRVSRKKKGGLLPTSSICCKAEDVKFVKAHGATGSKILDDGEEGGIASYLPDKIIIPENTFVITLNEVGETSPYDARVDAVIKRFYAQKNTLFNDKDTSRKLSPQGLAIQTHFLENIGVNYKFKNHIPGMSMNNITLNFKDNCTEKSCSIDCLNSSGKWHIENCLPKSRDKTDVIKTTLSELLEDQGPGVYIIQVCRSLTIPEGLPELEEQYKRVARQISSDAGITQEQYVHERKLSEDYFTKMQAPKYGTSVTTTKLSNAAYNDRTGKVVEPKAFGMRRLQPGRVAVLLDSETKPISVKRQNIKL